MVQRMEYPKYHTNCWFSSVSLWEAVESAVSEVKDLKVITWLWMTCVGRGMEEQRYLRNRLHAGLLFVVHFYVMVSNFDWMLRGGGEESRVL